MPTESLLCRRLDVVAVFCRFFFSFHSENGCTVRNSHSNETHRRWSVALISRFNCQFWLLEIQFRLLFPLLDNFSFKLDKMSPMKTNGSYVSDFAPFPYSCKADERPTPDATEKREERNANSVQSNWLEVGIRISNNCTQKDDAMECERVPFSQPLRIWYVWSISCYNGTVKVFRFVSFHSFLLLLFLLFIPFHSHYGWFSFGEWMLCGFNKTHSAMQSVDERSEHTEI